MALYLKGARHARRKLVAWVMTAAILPLRLTEPDFELKRSMERPRSRVTLRFKVASFILLHELTRESLDTVPLIVIAFCTCTCRTGFMCTRIV